MEDCDKQFKHLTAGNVTDTQALRILAKKVSGMKRQTDEERHQTFTLVVAVFTRRRMPVPENIFGDLLRVCVLEKKDTLFDRFTMFFADRAKNGHRAQALAMVQDERTRLCAIYRSMGGREQKASLRERLEQGSLALRKQKIVSPEVKAMESELAAFAEIERAVVRLDGLARR
jgi:hypothetical protein